MRQFGPGLRQFAWLVASLITSCATLPQKPQTPPRPAPPRCVSFCSEVERCAAKVQHADLSEILCLTARCETGDKCISKIDSPNGKYHGPFQFVNSTWKESCIPFFKSRQDKRCLQTDAVYDTCCATMCAARMIADGGIRNWPTCGVKAKRNSSIGLKEN